MSLRDIHFSEPTNWSPFTMNILPLGAMLFFLIRNHSLGQDLFTEIQLGAKVVYLDNTVQSLYYPI